MLERIVVGALNHLLGTEDWARTRLKPFAGRNARFEFGPLALTMVVRIDGTLAQPAVAHEGADVSIRLPEDTLVRLLVDRDNLFGSARLSGSADFAEALGFVLRNLRWDIEADIARFTGDTVAHRLVGTMTGLVSAKKESASRLAANLSEFAADEANWLLRPKEVASFSRELAQLQEALSRLEARISRL